MLHAHKGPATSLSILQVNVGRGAPPHELALSIANDYFIDFILIQEPYVFTDHTQQITKVHPMYETFTPLDDWTDRPRVMSYVQKGTGIWANQIRPIMTHDAVFLQLQNRNSSALTIANIYNAPPGSAGAGDIISMLISLLQSILKNAFLAGDFNVHHHRWDPQHPQPSVTAGPLVDWLDSNTFAYTSEVGVSTHIRGNVLDLAFVAGNVTASMTVAEHLDVTSDHTLLLLYINWNIQTVKAACRLRLNTLDQELFTTLLKDNCSLLVQLTDSSSTHELDLAATKLTEAISAAYKGSAK